MIFESLLSDDDSITLIQNGGENSHFQNADNTYLSNNQTFSQLNLVISRIVKKK